MVSDHHRLDRLDRLYSCVASNSERLFFILLYFVCVSCFGKEESWSEPQSNGTQLLPLCACECGWIELSRAESFIRFDRVRLLSTHHVCKHHIQLTSQGTLILPNSCLFVSIIILYNPHPRLGLLLSSPIIWCTAFPKMCRFIHTCIWVIVHSIL